jgi:two-component system, OmpR family, KDP operon response regulator KdpE
VSGVLIVDDDAQILRTLAVTVRAAGYEVRCAANAHEALQVAAAAPPDLVVLDLGLPDGDGTDVIRALRGWTDVPIIVLSGRTGSSDKVRALDAGADDYVTKPFGADELLARLRAARRRSGGGDASPTVRMGDLVVDLARRTVTRSGGQPAGGDVAAEPAVHLTPTEWALLEVLVRRPGRLVSRRDLVTRVWGPEHAGDDDSLRVHVAKLRRKLEPDPSRPRHLVTEPGMGYRFQP